MCCYSMSGTCKAPIRGEALAGEKEINTSYRQSLSVAFIGRKVTGVTGSYLLLQKC